MVNGIIMLLKLIMATIFIRMVVLVGVIATYSAPGLNKAIKFLADLTPFQ
jgi:hypothetical protein